MHCQWLLGLSSIASASASALQGSELRVTERQPGSGADETPLADRGSDSATSIQAQAQAGIDSLIASVPGLAGNHHDYCLLQSHWQLTSGPQAGPGHWQARRRRRSQADPGVRYQGYPVHHDVLRPHASDWARTVGPQAPSPRLRLRSGGTVTRSLAAWLRPGFKFQARFRLVVLNSIQYS